MLIGTQLHRRGTHAHVHAKQNNTGVFPFLHQSCQEGESTIARHAEFARTNKHKDSRVLPAKYRTTLSEPIERTAVPLRFALSNCLITATSELQNRGPRST